jgi:predicted branched-subunit amino acid permease
MSVRPETARIFNLIQLISEVGIAVGYLIGLIPFVYLWSCTWVIPLVFLSLIVALLNKNGTLVYTFANIVLSFLSFIPLLGYVFRIAGILVSLLNIRMLRGGSNKFY